jgi:hypothetical protein
MRKTVLLAGVVALLALPILAASSEEIIEQAVQPLPADLRAGATVVTYERATGERKVLRKGTNTLECEPENPDDGFTRCYSNLTVPRREMTAKLRAQGKTDKEIQEAVAAAIKAGTIKTPPFGTMSYRLSKKDTVIKRLWVMSTPFATPETIGVSTVSQRDAALKGHGLPWLMLAGTPNAHVMIPVAE